MIRTVIVGAGGRMGRVLIALTLQDPELKLVGAVEAVGSPLQGQDAGVVAGVPACGVRITANLAEALRGADGLIDFTVPESTRETVRAGAAAGVSMVIGTTGLTDADRAQMAALARNGARLFVAPNMSVGVNLLFHLCGKVANILGPNYDIEVVEMHHRRKKDAPSGTAVRLAEVLAQATGRSYADDVRHGRHGIVGVRTAREIGMHALRGGDVVGDHTVIFATDGERVELTHKASSRETFANGALRALKFVAKAAPGRVYDMQDVLGLREG